MDFLDPTDITYRHYNERDVEIPAVLQSIRSASPHIHSLLDVGAHYSVAHYAEEIRAILSSRRYDGVDLLDCADTRKILDNYYLGNVCDVELPCYDSVICISAIEHAGMSTYHKPDASQERDRVFDRILELAQHHIFLTFPFGQPCIGHEFANITATQLGLWEAKCVAYGYRVQADYWFNEFAQMKELWHRISFDEAIQVPYRPERGGQCLALLEATKI